MAGGGGSGRGGVRLWGQGRCVQRSEVVVKIKKKMWGRGDGLGDQGRCEQRSEVFVKLKKKCWGGGSGQGVGLGRGTG